VSLAPIDVRQLHFVDVDTGASIRG